MLDLLEELFTGPERPKRSVSPDDLGRALVSAARNGHTDVVNTLIEKANRHREFYKKIPPIFIDRAISAAFRHPHIRAALFNAFVQEQPVY